MGQLTTVEEPVSFTSQPGDLAGENLHASSTVGVDLGVEPADCADDRGDAVLRQAGPLAGEALAQCQRVLGM